MTNATVSVYLDSSYTRQDGTSRFYIRVTLNRKTKKIPLNLFIKPEYYNPKTKKIKEIREVPDAKKNNLYLKDKESEVEQIIIELERRKQSVTFSNILSLYSNSEVNGSFIEFARNRLSEERNRIKSVITSYSIHYTKLYEVWPSHWRRCRRGARRRWIAMARR